MSKKIIRAKRWDQLWFRNPRGSGWDIISVIAWVVPDSGPAVPITCFGRVDETKPYIVGSGNDFFIAFPSGHIFSNQNEVRYFLETGNVW
jgi:hypothetical protein